MSDYTFWKDSLAGAKPKMFVDDPRLGFYRKSITQRNAAGNNRRVGWQPVAVFMDGGVMTARLGNEQSGDDVTGDRLNELWSYIAANAISEDWYRAVARHGRDWPDAHDPAKNKPEPATPAPANVVNEPSAISPEDKLAQDIAQAKAGASQYDKIESDEQAGRALSLKNTITTLAGDLDKHRETLVRPHIDAQREVNDRLNPIIKDAKAQSQTLLRSIGAWEDFKRERAARAQALADAKRREHEDAVRAAEAANKPPPPAPEPERPNTPPPSSQVAAAVGRKASVKVAKFVTDIDVDKAFAQFRAAPEIKAALMALAQRAVTAGLPVDSATIEERSVVR